jgi:uncharacterized metal-binding protein YceD (DUF177 family)
VFKIDKKYIRSFDLALSLIKEEVFVLNYDIDNQFFTNIEDTIIEEGVFQVAIEITPILNGFKAKFSVKGRVEFVCDVSLESFTEDISNEDYIIFQYGEKDLIENEHLMILNVNSPTINFSSYIYEQIAVNVPFKKVHPSLRKEESESEQEIVPFYSTHNFAESKEDEKIVEDTRWLALKNLKFEN